MQNQLIIFVLSSVLLITSYIFLSVYAQENVSGLYVTIIPPEGEEIRFIVNSTEEMKDLVMAVAEKNNLNASASRGDLPIAVNNTINSIIDNLTSVSETFRSQLSAEGLSPESISMCADIPFVGKVCL